MIRNNLNTLSFDNAVLLSRIKGNPSPRFPHKRHADAGYAIDYSRLYRYYVGKDVEDRNGTKIKKGTLLTEHQICYESDCFLEERHKKLKLTYAPTIQECLEWIEGVMGLNIKTRVGDDGGMTEIIIDKPDCDHGTVLLAHVFKGEENDVLQNVMHKILSIYKSGKSARNMSNSLLEWKQELDKEQGDGKIIICNRWIPCAEDNGWLDNKTEYAGIYRTIVQKDDCIYTRNDCPYGWNVLIQSGAHLMNIRLRHPDRQTHDAEL